MVLLDIFPAFREKPHHMIAEPVVLAVTLSDLAILELGTAKVSMVGCFHRLLVPKLPAVHPEFFATVSLTNLLLGHNRIEFAVRIEEEKTGEVIGTGRGTLDVNLNVIQRPTSGPLVFDARKMGMDFPIRMPSLTFLREGAYRVVVMGNEAEFFQRGFVVQKQ